MDDDRRRMLAATFDSAAEVYQRSRPGFAAAALDWALTPDARRVLDLGAGTGKLTASLVERGLDVVAVDPSPNMLAQLTATLPTVNARLGTAEQIPVDLNKEEPFDAVVAGSAFHWFTRPDADRELARVLAPGGVAALLWNHHDEDAPTTRAWNAVLADADRPRGQGADDYRLDERWFAPTEEASFPHTQHVTPDQLVDLLASRSYVIAMSPQRRDEVLGAMRHFLDTEPDLAGRDSLAIGYRTVVRRAAVHDAARP